MTKSGTKEGLIIWEKVDRRKDMIVTDKVQQIHKYRSVSGSEKADGIPKEKIKYNH